MPPLQGDGPMDTRVFRALHEIAVAVGGVLEPVELARLVVDRARELLGVDAVGVYVFDEATQLLQPIYSSDAREDWHPEPTIAPGIGAAGQALLHGEPILVDDYTEWPNAGHWAVARGVRSAMAVPLLVTDRRTGAVSARTYSPRRWTPDDAQTLTLLAAQIGPALEAARLHERTRVARQQAEAAITQRDEVLAAVSHDLSQPLARIQVYAELIQAESANLRPQRSVGQISSWSERIVASTISMKTMMQDLVDVARLQMGQALNLDLRRTDLIGLVERLADERRALGRLLNLSTRCPDLLGWWDEGRLSRLFANLLDNAFKYSPPEASVDMRVDHLREDDLALAVVQIRDRGQGIPAEDLPRVFERYYRGSNVGEHTTGSGLGLAVARQIVQQHGGTIDIESAPGTGTVVTVRLPIPGPPEPPSSDLD
jgi:signal transduction histidine kinase